MQCENTYNIKQAQALVLHLDNIFNDYRKFQAIVICQVFL